jgi:hypothetical protein
LLVTASCNENVQEIDKQALSHENANGKHTVHQFHYVLQPCLVVCFLFVLVRQKGQNFPVLNYLSTT